MTVFVRSPYNYDVDAASIESGLKCEDESMTKQEFAAECDINTIVRNFGLTGEMPATLVTPMQGDFTNVMDYRSALHMLMEAQDGFMSLPAEFRAKFDNDPNAFLDYVSDPANVKEMQEKYGLGAIQRPAPEPMLVKVVPEPPPAA